ncbi:MarR family transcriptional regulator [uncultured Roseobacter sp.]|uniref:MarR family winged helix-turn-helix transcriptional regulator n=1 Tax=uncultured Roseobacter sp. TaxID=114847 RepID=UPI00260C2F06|nr:MarR family transcriptional regulator [uncultured Roseobacter sp.]
MTDRSSEELARHISTIIKNLLVTGRQGAPAEGLLAFNPLYFQILRMVGGSEGTRPSVMASDLAVPRTTISAAVKALQGKGLVTTTPDQTDGRAVVVSLTRQGEEVLAAITRQDNRNAKAMLNALSKQERPGFVKAMKKIAATVSESPES